MSGCVFLARELSDELTARAVRAFPREACGVLVGMTRADALFVTGVVELANRSPHAASFELDPVELVAAERAARASGAEILGTWHSHPDRPARPSRADRVGSWPGALNLIVPTSAAGGGPARVWRTCSR